MKKLIRKLISRTPMERLIRKYISKPVINFNNSPEYWEKRYASNGNSGAGSYGRLAEFKASILNKFVYENDVKSVIEWGCGDGNQLTLADYPNYLGLDISSTAITLCEGKFANDPSKSFKVLADAEDVKAELSISLDVIYHLVEENIYDEYMQRLFTSSKRFVCIYSTNYEDDFADGARHVRHRKFTNWVQEHAPNWELTAEVKNIHPYDLNDPDNTSLADFFFYSRR